MRLVRDLMDYFKKLTSDRYENVLDVYHSIGDGIVDLWESDMKKGFRTTKLNPLTGKIISKGKTSFRELREFEKLSKED